MKQHSRRSKAYRGLPEAREQSETHGDLNIKYHDWGPLAMIDGVAVGHCIAFWTCKSIAVCQSCASFGKKRSLQNLILEL